MAEKYMGTEKQMANAFTAHCRPRSCGRQRAASKPTKATE